MSSRSLTPDRALLQITVRQLSPDDAPDPAYGDAWYCESADIYHLHESWVKAEFSVTTSDNGETVYHCQQCLSRALATQMDAWLIAIRDTDASKVVS
jgi:hypothetical protein